jgi:Leucine-rich repeat (LRR) protein
MRLTNTLSTLITEQSRFQVLYDKLVKPSDKPRKPGEKPKGAMDFETLKNIIFGDPSTTVPQGFDKESATFEDMGKIHVGKYVQWMLKNFIQPKLEDEVGTPEYKQNAKEYRRLFIEDMDKLNVDLLKFERFKSRLPVGERDINKYTPQTLSLAVDEFKLTKDSKSAKEERITKENPYKFEGSTIDFVGPNWTIVKIEDKTKIGDAAADYFGGYYDTRDEFDETNWCTSNVGGSYFYTYIKDGPLYVIIPNNATEFGKKTGLPKERYQFHFPSNQYMDRRDRQINLVEFLNGKGEELKEYFKPQFAKGLVKGGSGNVVDIAYPDNAAGKFIALYGFDELFDSLPDTIERLLISNKSNEDIALVVPESIGRFKNLEALKLEKICKSIPDSICNLKLLNFLALPNNKQLESLPECLMTLPELAFINLKDSNPNVKIPEKLKERLTDEGMGFYYFN